MRDNLKEAVEIIDSIARVVPVPMFRINRAIFRAIFDGRNETPDIRPEAERGEVRSKVKGQRSKPESETERGAPDGEEEVTVADR